MATYTDLMSLFNDIGSAINDKGVNGQHYPYQMASAIRSISTGISVSGTYTVTSAGSGIDIRQYASLNVPTGGYSLFGHLDRSTATYEYGVNKYRGWYSASGRETAATTLPSTSISTITPSTSSQIAVSQYTWTLNDVVVEAIPNSYIIPEGTSTITANGTYDITSFASVSVAIPIGDFINNQEDIVVTPTEEEQIVSAAAGYTGLGPVTINGISSTYVGTGIATISSANVTVAGQSVTAPAGYYSSAITKAVATMTLPTTFPTTSTGTVVTTIGRSTATRYLNIPVGYNTTSRFYTISSVPNGTVTAPTTISSTSATLTAGTNTITLAKTISVTPNVTTAGYISTGTAGNANVTLTAAVTTKAASTITPTTTSQTAVAANTYVTGAITVAAIPSSYKLLSQTTTATSSTMLESVTAYNSNGELMTGNVHVITYYTGTFAPTSSLGNNGDIYLQS